MRRSLALTALVCGCAPASDGESLGPPDDPDGPGTVVRPDLLAPTTACDLDAPDPTRLLVTTTDFSTGALSVVDLATGTLELDVAVGSTDAVPFVVGGHVVVVHRFGLDRIDTFDPSTWNVRGQVAVPTSHDAPSRNPHAVVAGPDGHLLVTSFGEAGIVELDPLQVPARAVVGEIDLSVVADDDGNPDASAAVACGASMYVVTQRLDGSLSPRGEDALVAIDLHARAVVDADPSTETVDVLPTLGTWLRQLRRDPTDPSGQTLLGLSTGIERIDLSAGEVTWAVPASRFVEAGAADFLQPQSFDVSDDGTQAFLAIYDADFSQVQLYRVGLDDHAPAVPEPFAAGFDSVEHTLELVGTELWYGSTRHDAPGLWRFDTTTDPPSSLAGPLSTGLPPYSIVTLP